MSVTHAIRLQADRTHTHTHTRRTPHTHTHTHTLTPVTALGDLLAPLPTKGVRRVDVAASQVILESLCARALVPLLPGL